MTIPILSKHFWLLSKAVDTSLRVFRQDHKKSDRKMSGGPPGHRFKKSGCHFKNLVANGHREF